MMRPARQKQEQISVEHLRMNASPPGASDTARGLFGTTHGIQCVRMELIIGPYRLAYRTFAAASFRNERLPPTPITSKQAPE
jgi:hypothetical protein